MEVESAAPTDPPARLSGDDGGDRIVAAVAFLRGVRPAGGGPYRETDTACQKARLQAWAERAGFLVSPEVILPKLRRGGQEYDYFLDHATGRCIKLTRDGVFGLTPGIDLALAGECQKSRKNASDGLWMFHPMKESSLINFEFT